MAIRIESQAEPIPGYRLIERLGGGGFGEVWKCEAPGGLHKAIKFVYGDLQTSNTEDGVRAEQELKALSRVKTVRHPYILSLERYDIIGGQLIIVMELADRNLWDRFRECRTQNLPGIPREELLGYMAESSEALDLMNQEYQLQHLDIKPQNLFLVHNHIKVADFGLVKDLEGMVASVTGGVTPVYAAPETFDGWVSRYCDQYSLAIVYQELLTGVRPFPGNNVRQLILQHLQGTPDLSSLPPQDRDIIAKALDKNPDNRHPTCQQLVKALREAGGGAVLVSVPAGGGPGAGFEESDSGADDAAAGPRTPSAAPKTPPEIPEAPPSSGPVTCWIRSHDRDTMRRERGAVGPPLAVRPQPRPEATPAPAPAERPPATPAAPAAQGDGVLFPALVIGLGGLGRDVLKRLAASLTERFGSTQALPQLRLLYLDTDPDAPRLATAEDDGAALQRGDILLAPLHRPSHYLKPVQGKQGVASWLDPKMLYRIPRNAYPSGMRALGRLAFVDNFRAIAQRLKADLQACVDPEALAAAQRQTGLGMRMNWPRVYVVTGLAGGTGGGIFLDLAYTVRALLRQLGYEQPDVVGVFLVPQADARVSPGPGLGNAYAALTELHHFSTPGTTFAAKYEASKDGPLPGQVKDAEAPFRRCVFLPLGGAKDKTPAGRLAGPSPAAPTVALAGQFLVAELTSPLGRGADARRDKVFQNPESSSLFADDRPARPTGLACQAFGLHRVVWPRRVLLRQAARRVCASLVERWMSKDGKPVRDKVQAWVNEQWSKQDLGAEGLIPQLHEACERALKKPAEAVIAGLIEPLAAEAGAQPGSDANVESVHEVVLKLENLLGAPVSNPNKPPVPAKLDDILADAGARLASMLDQKMAELAVHLIEKPAFRLAGAEEAIRLLTGMIEQILQHHEQFAKDNAERTLTAYAGVQAALKQLNALAAGKVPVGARKGGRGGWFGGGGGPESGPPSAQQFLDLLRSYAKSRYQSLILQQVNAIYVSLRGLLSDQMREVGFCRNRLGELARSLESKGPGGVMTTDLQAGAAGLVRILLPPGCTTLEEALEGFLEGIDEARLEDLDNRMEALIRKDFAALVQVCLGSANQLRSLEFAMQEEAENALGELLTDTNIVDLFLARHGDGAKDQAAAEVAAAFDQAAPALDGLVAGARASRATDFCIITAPAGPDGQSGAARLRGLAEKALDGEDLTVLETPPGTSPNEILVYREDPAFSLPDLKLLGPVGREAYQQLSSVEHFTPHARMDITEWQFAGAR